MLMPMHEEPGAHVLKFRYFEPHRAGIHVLAGFFVLVLLLLIVLESARSMTSTSTIRLGGLSTSRIKSKKRNFKMRTQGHRLKDRRRYG
jgi:hypothetical protein